MSRKTTQSGSIGLLRCNEILYRFGGFRSEQAKIREPRNGAFADIIGVGHQSKRIGLETWGRVEEPSGIRREIDGDFPPAATRGGGGLGFDGHESAVFVVGTRPGLANRGRTRPDVVQGLTGHRPAEQLLTQSIRDAPPEISPVCVETEEDVDARSEIVAMLRAFAFDFEAPFDSQSPCESGRPSEVEIGGKVENKCRCATFAHGAIGRATGRVQLRRVEDLLSDAAKRERKPFGFTRRREGNDGDLGLIR
jgi:hypothetical protein